MEQFRKILVAMNPEEDMSTSIGFASRISRLSGSEEVHFYHVSDEPDLPPELCTTVEDQGTCETVIGQMMDQVEKAWDGRKDAKLLYDASSGDMLKDVLTYIKKKDIDLVLVENECGGSKIPERLARKAPCSVLLLPSGAQPTLEKIYTALDFSDSCRDALELALFMAKSCGIDKVTCLHVFSVPTGYSKTGHTQEEFADILKQNAERDYQKLIDKLDTRGVQTELITRLHKTPHQGIAELATAGGADLLTVGSRGRSKTMAVLLGSVPERLIEACGFPLLATKKKGQGWSLLEAMFNM